jgi:hypothetical protein
MGNKLLQRTAIAAAELYWGLPPFTREVPYLYIQIKSFPVKADARLSSLVQIWVVMGRF